MITYSKQSLKVHNIFGYPNGDSGEYYSHTVARRLKEFIEKGEYVRIADIFIYGESNKSLVCSIVYQAKKGKNDIHKSG